MLIAGPCAVESRDQAFKIARFVQSEGATHFRAGSFKGQNRPFPNGKPAYMGLGEQAMKILGDIEKELDMPTTSEAQSSGQAAKMIDYGISYIQIGARHMQNFPMLSFLGKINYTPGYILKRGLGSTIDEWLGAAEWLGGPSRVILCERGIASFDRTPTTRWRLDFVDVAFLRRYHPKYRVIVDVSHGSGDRE